MIGEKKQKDSSDIARLADKGVYGWMLVLDLHRCDPSRFTRVHIDDYFRSICRAIKMTRCELYWWDDLDVPNKERQISVNTTGTSAVQFILTSSIVIHTLTKLKSAYVDIFSCKPFDASMAELRTKNAFDAKIVIPHFLTRTYIR